MKKSSFKPQATPTTVQLNFCRHIQILKHGVLRVRKAMSLITETHTRMTCYEAMIVADIAEAFDRSSESNEMTPEEL